jgi:lipid-A-disaccharide synthase-like uncharacterized protein
MDYDLLWLAIGFAGQALFSMRFIVQWISSERRQQSVVPVAFWYYSLAGGITLLIYAISRLDPVFIAGQLMGIFIYARNLHLIASGPRAEAQVKENGAYEEG